jgi:hypothetical protein
MTGAWQPTLEPRPASWLTDSLREAAQLRPGNRATVAALARNPAGRSNASMPRDSEQCTNGLLRLRNTQSPLRHTLFEEKPHHLLYSDYEKPAIGERT